MNGLWGLFFKQKEVYREKISSHSVSSPASYSSHS